MNEGARDDRQGEPSTYERFFCAVHKKLILLLAGKVQLGGPCWDCDKAKGPLR